MFVFPATNVQRVYLRGEMRIYFCPDCGAHSIGPGTACDECRADLPEDSWAEVSEDELHQLDYVDDFELPPGAPVWEYDVVRLKSDAEAGGLTYTTELLDRMGDKGWELVSIVPLADKDGPRYGVFKRSWSEEFE